MTRTAPFSAKAIRNACIAAAFAVPPVGFIGLAAIGNAVGGDTATTPKAEVVAKQPEKKDLWQPTKTNIRQLAFACSQQRLKPFLKDPSSLRILNRGMSELTDTHVTVWVDYTATNGFGGPARDTFTCTYTR